MKTKAYAKVNLHLQVGKKTSSGLHLIYSLMQKIDLYDELEINIVKANNFSCNILGLSVENNSMEKAARLWSSFYEIPFSIIINIKKQIPSEAGLGGPSTDAASVLLALDSYFSKPANYSLALSVGSDVPFFISGYKAAIVSGTGEKIEFVRAKELSGFLIVPKNKTIATTWAYSQLDNYPIKPFWNYYKLMFVYELPFEDYNFVNDFTLINEKLPTSFLNNLADNEYLFLSGSGCSWVLLTKREEIKVEGCNIQKINFLN